MNDQAKLLSSLDIFLLALIDSGVATAYAMRVQAGISVGAARPAMQRLKNLGLVVEGKAGVRKKMAFRLTRRGRIFKVSELNRLLEALRAKSPSNVESIMRVAALAMFEARYPEAKGLLRKSAEEFRRRAGETQKPIGARASGVAGLYQSMMASVSATQLMALSRALTDLAATLKKLPATS